MSPKGKMFILKRNGRKQTIEYGKITARIQKQCNGLDMNSVNPLNVTIKIICGLYSGITALELDNLAAESAASMTTIHQDYAILATRIAVTSLHKRTKVTFSCVMSALYKTVDPSTKKKAPILDDRFHRIIQRHSGKFNSAIKHNRDLNYDYFSLKALERHYLLKIGGQFTERPQHMFMRVAIGIHGDDIEKVVETYNLMSEKYFIHASPMLRTACTVKSQLSSSFLLTMADDSIEGMCGTLRKCALISKFSGGIGLNVHCIRAKGASVACMGESKGVVQMLRCFNQMASYFENEGGESGSFTIYLEPWHADIFEFLNLRKVTDKNDGSRDLFPALWMCDLLMQRILDDKLWSLMCPRESPGLSEVWGKQFEDLYTKYEREGRYKRQIPARELWTAIMTTQMETGSPYMLYKDHCNKKSNHKHVGTIKSGNRCTDILQYSNSDEVAVCALASIAVNRFVNVKTKKFDFEKLRKIVKIVARNLDKAIEVNYYPTPESERSSRRHRPIGIGVQGLADTFLLLRYPYDSAQARKLNIQIFETLYYAALEASTEMAEAMGPHATYDGSPASRGILQYDMWGVKPTKLWNWMKLKEKIADSGLRNSLMIAVMPTHSTAEIFGNNNSVEPYSSNMKLSRFTYGEVQVINPHLTKDLKERKLWDEDMEQEIIKNNGSIQDIDRIPENLKKLHKTVWEISHETLINMAADRAPFVDQSQSLNIYMTNPTTEDLNAMHFKCWRMGLKTGMYFLHTRTSVKTSQSNEDEPNPKRAKIEISK